LLYALIHKVFDLGRRPGEAARASGMSKGFHPDQEFSRRMLMAGVGGGVVWAGLVARLFQLQILEGKKYDELANENHIKLELAPPQRGRILDRFGKPLASHRRAGRVTVIPEQLKDPAATIASIRQLIELSDPGRARHGRHSPRTPAPGSVLAGHRRERTVL
jgi:cell division protein FtsI/penicillin-binding protein 2